ncbi:hypothetical protein RRG08_062014 [Elysia crispata]|uniref:C-type lectin domain-containing protein n=1 Tax=Elysia crispata TaxID=231223 RepID=A0AAE1A3S4_9GAST|nr:hypothetical protein RRG08_062014 [Elysia crispata]
MVPGQSSLSNSWRRFSPNAGMIQFVFERIIFGEEYYWLGLHRHSDGVFRWLDDDTKTNYTYWEKRIEPKKWEDNDVGAGILTHDGGRWKDREKDNTQGYVCEKAVDCCSGQWKKSRYSGTCIKVFGESKSWDRARRACRSHGGDLVRILNAGMNQFIHELIKLDGSRFYWIGLHVHPKGEFRWLDDDTKANYTTWAAGQPDSWGRETAAQMRNLGRGRWYNFKKGWDFKGYICERPAVIFQRLTNTRNGSGYYVDISTSKEPEALYHQALADISLTSS